MIDNINEEFEKMSDAFDEEGNLIEGKEFDPEGKVSLDEKLKLAQDLIQHQQNVRKEEESLLEKINKTAEHNAALPRVEKRERLRRILSDYKKHFKLKPKIDINDSDEESFNKTIEINNWFIRKRNLETLIVRYGNQNKLDKVKKEIEKL